MEILLLHDIPGVGKKNDLLVVGDGFALNCLLPKRAALVATPLVRRRYAEFIKRRAEEREKEKALSVGKAKDLEGKVVTFKRKTTKTGKLYAAITEQNIADALKDQLSVEVSEDAVRIDEPIKALGSYTVTLQMAESVVELTVAVEAEMKA